MGVITMDGEDIRCFIIRDRVETIQIYCGDCTAFTFETPEDAVAMTLPIPTRIPIRHEILLSVEETGDLKFIRLDGDGAEIPYVKILNPRGYAILRALVMKGYRRLVPMQKI